jgi:microcystin-dependent protein
VPYISELRIFPWDATPDGWVPCHGQLLAINQNQALFTLIGTMYGGDGQRQFALPDLRGRVPIGTAPRIPAGQKGGEEDHTLTGAELAHHSHAMQAVAAGTTANPQDAMLAGAPIWGLPNDLTPLQPAAVAPAGGSQPHENKQPYLALNVCIAVKGTYPSAN